MEFEVLHRSKRKQFIIAGCFVVLILVAIVIGVTFAKYRVTKSIELASGTVNYTRADLNLVGVYLEKKDQVGQYDSSEDVPTSGYTLNTEKSYCTGSEGVSITYTGGKLNFSGLSKRGTKCYAYFDVIRDTQVPTISNVTSSVTKTSITVNVTASDNEGVTKYFYSINNGAYTETTSSSHTFNSLTAGTSYSIKIKVQDAAGNESTEWTGSIKTESDNVGVTLLANYPTVLTRSSFSSVLTTSTTDTIYKATTSKGTTYYFAGNPTDNWVKFANKYWRIIRINEDGSLRLIYQGTSANITGTGTQITVDGSNTSAFNTSYNNNAYVGFKYTLNDVHGTGTNSTILGKLNTWYQDNLSSYADKIDGNAGFCGDRTSTTSSSGAPNDTGGTGTTTTYYGARYRLVNNKKPTFECSDSHDLYTTSGSSQGNKALQYPIGLITADEVAYAGGVYGTNNTSYYLYTRQDYWTMSPYYYNGSAGVFLVWSDGILNDNWVYFGYGVRPVINLKSSVQITGGDGSSGNPYVLSIA